MVYVLISISLCSQNYRGQTIRKKEIGSYSTTGVLTAGSVNIWAGLFLVVGVHPVH